MKARISQLAAVSILFASNGFFTNAQSPEDTLAGEDIVEADSITEVEPVTTEETESTTIEPALPADASEESSEITEPALPVDASEENSEITEPTTTEPALPADASEDNSEITEPTTTEPALPADALEENSEESATTAEELTTTEEVLTTEESSETGETDDLTEEIVEEEITEGEIEEPIIVADDKEDIVIDEDEDSSSAEISEIITDSELKPTVGAVAYEDDETRFSFNLDSSTKLPSKVTSVPFVDYSEHGKNWEDECTKFVIEQSPINISAEQLEQNDLIQFDLLYQHKVDNATVTLDGEASIVRVDYPNIAENDLLIFNELFEESLYHLSHMYWKTPAEHTIGGKTFDAELQIYHIQYATDRQVAFSILFDQELAEGKDESKLKTCFYDSFDFTGARIAFDVDETPSIIEVPIKEFIEYMPMDNFAYYYGSETTPDCHESVTWIVNLEPTVITEKQVEQLKALMNTETAKHGNNRDIQKINERTVYKFSNVGKTTKAERLAAEAEQAAEEAENATTPSESGAVSRLAFSLAAVSMAAATIVF